MYLMLDASLYLFSQVNQFNCVNGAVIKCTNWALFVSWSNSFCTFWERVDQSFEYSYSYQECRYQYALVIRHSLLLAKKTTAAGAGRKKAVDMDSSSDFDFGESKPKKQPTPKAAPKVKATKPKVTKAPKKMAVSSDVDSSDEESSGGKKKAAVRYAFIFCFFS